MSKTFNAYKLIFRRTSMFYLCSFLIILSILIISYGVLDIKSAILDSILNVVSILFPLIAGFLTFGRDLIKDLNDKINSIKEISESRIGRPIPDSEKKKIITLKNLASNFKNIIISTFFISFILIIIILIAKFNSFDFKTSYLVNNCFKKYFIENGLNYFFKIVFFKTLLILFLNLSYLVYFIIQVNKDDEIKI
jgi:hypothetical protein